MHSIQRAFTHWKKLPGNWDTLNFREAVFSAENDYGIPTIARDASVPASLIQWGSKPKLRAIEEKDNACVHFFLDDYRFESLWNHPARHLDVLEHVGMALSPDFSLFRDMPVAMQIWNVYRNRWLGRYWQEHGIQVIPTISWSEPYDFCYLGVEPGSIVAISTVGVVQDKASHRYFRAGYERMVDMLEPEAILCYGSLSALGIADPRVITFPTRWEKRSRVLEGYDWRPLWDIEAIGA